MVLWKGKRREMGRMRIGMGGMSKMGLGGRMRANGQRAEASEVRNK